MPTTDRISHSELDSESRFTPLRKRGARGDLTRRFAAKSVDLSFAFGLKPERAVDYMKSKGYTFSWRWEETLGAAHAKAFTVAKVTRMDVLQDIRGMVEKSIEDGLTFEQFKKELTPMLQKKGWWGEKFVASPDGTVERIMEGSPHRLKTIYHQNTMTAYSAGREEFFQANAAFRPYAMLVAVLDERTRATHRALNGKVYPLSDPIWRTHTPPLDWGCRCRKRAVSQRYVDKNNLKVLRSEGQIEKTDALVSTATGEIRQVTTVTLPGGQKVSTGVGFDYNPATAAWQPDLDSYDADIARKYLEGAITGPDFARFFAGKVDGNFPVGMVDDALGISAESRVIHFSEDSLLKNKGLLERSIGHPELKLEEYQLLPKIFDEAQVVVKKPDGSYQFFREEGGVIYTTAVKRTAAGEVFMQTFHRTSIRYARAQMKTGTVLRNLGI